MAIKWDEVTSLSQSIAIVLFIAVFGIGFWLGTAYESKTILGEPTASANFICPDKTVIAADFYTHFVRIETPSLGKMHLPRTISASGARYQSNDGEVVFWNKGDTAFIEQNGTTTLDNCLAEQKPAPVENKK